MRTALKAPAGVVTRYTPAYPAVERPALSRLETRDQVAQRRVEVHQRLIGVRDLTGQDETALGGPTQVQRGLLADRPLPGLSSSRHADRCQTLALRLTAARAGRDSVPPFARLPPRDPGRVAQRRRGRRVSNDALTKNLKQVTRRRTR